MKPTKCREPGCEETHKHVSGYCVNHVGKHDRSRVHVPLHERACVQPMLQEERTGGYMIPRVI